MLLNGKYSDKASNGNFLAAVCDEIAGDKPAGCNNAALLARFDTIEPCAVEARKNLRAVPK